MKHWKTQIGPIDTVRTTGQNNSREKHTDAERTPRRMLDVREVPKLAPFLKAPAESLDSILVFERGLLFVTITRDQNGMDRIDGCSTCAGTESRPKI